MSSPQTHTLFFYGTLLHPPILARALHGPTPPPAPSHITTTPALLPSHRRHRVRNADYPAILPHPTSSVLGTLARGLSPSDVRRLDLFEGAEYARVPVTALVPRHRPAGGDEPIDEADCDAVPAETYLWIAGAARLEDQEWDLASFKRDKLRFWIGADGEEGSTGGAEFGVVDEAEAGRDGTGGRGMDGEIGRALEAERVVG